MHFPITRPDKTPGSAFRFAKLLADCCILSLLGLIVLRVSARAVCLKNLKRIPAVVAMYSTDNRDFLPRPNDLPCGSGYQ